MTATNAYDGNRLINVSEAVANQPDFDLMEFKSQSASSPHFTYNVNGNLTKDLHKNIIGIEYNSLNLPKRTAFGDNKSIAYVYDASGVKHETEHYNPTLSPTTSKTIYISNKIYENSTLSMILTEEGYLKKQGNSYQPFYYVKDHLGSNRMALDATGVSVLETNYYPFGMSFADNPLRDDQSVQRNKYTGKELDREHGLNLYDYGARMYDPTVDRYTTMDPLAEKYYSISPYAYCLNNPVKFVDPTGMYIDWYQNGEDKIWQPSRDNTIVKNGKTYSNIGSSASIDNEDGTFTNYYQNIGFRSEQSFNAFQHIMGSDVLSNKHLGSSSKLWEQGKVDLMKAIVNKGRSDFVEHPASQFVISSTSFVATGGIEGIFSLANLGKSLLNKATKGGTTALRKVGSVLESIDDVIANPSLVNGKSYAQVRGILNNSEGWINSVMIKTRKTDKGLVFRQVNDG